MHVYSVRFVELVVVETFKEFTFDAAHELPPFSRLHGHTFTATVVLKGAQHPTQGRVLDLADLEHEVEQVRKAVDEKFLNEIEGLGTPSLENIAQWIFRRLDRVLPGVDRVMLRRGPSGSAAGCCYSAADEAACRATPVLALAE